jgi:hypothetical protein
MSTTLTSESIVNIYNSSRIQRPNPSNYDLFILIEGINILIELRGNKSFKDRRLAIRSAWNHLDFNLKTIYTDASLKLGYVSKFKNSFKSTRLLNESAVTRIKAINQRRILNS